MRDVPLDLRHLKCPLPVLRTRKMLMSVSAGTIVAVQCTDPLSVIDIPHLVRDLGDELVETSRQADVLVFRIRKR